MNNRQLARYGSILVRPARGAAVLPEELVDVTERLYQYVTERASIRYVDTILDLHPDIRFAPGEAAPID